jgi:hypothetical protein
MTSVEIPPHELTVSAGWYPDPRGEHHLRYFDGSVWTSHVTHFGPTPCHGCARSN